MKNRIWISLFGLFLASPAFCTGLSKSVLIGPKAIGMGGAFVAIADDPTALFHNPAGITQIKGQDLYFGIDGLLTDLTYTPTGGTAEDARTEGIPVPSFGYVNNNFGPVAFGFGVFFPHGNGGKFNGASAAPFNPTEGRIFSMEFLPTAAWQITPDLSIGATFRIVRVASELKGQLIDVDPTAGETFDTLENLDVTGWGYGASAGLRYQITDKISFGSMYRSKVSVDMSGNAEFSSGGAVETIFTTNTVAADLGQNLPTIVTAGFGFYPIEGLTLGVMYQYERNSEIKNLTATLADTATLTLPQDWSNSSTVHLGGEYWFTKGFAMRAGYAKDIDNSIPDTANSRIIGDIASHEVSLGLAHMTNQFNFGLTWNARFGERDIPVTATNPSPGNYDAFVQSISLGIGYNL